jgi:hypothetical protein
MAPIDLPNADPSRDPRAKAVEPEQFIDGTILREIKKRVCEEAVSKISKAGLSSALPCTL